MKKTNLTQSFFQKRLNQELNSRKISLNEFARQLNAPVSTVHGWLNGVDPKKINVIKKIADYLNLSIEELCFSELNETKVDEIKLIVNNRVYRLPIEKTEFYSGE
jgi:transcriptional regulator with XRE-family HTH domain